MQHYSFDFLWCGSSRAFTLSAASLSHIRAIVSYLLAQTTESHHTVTLTNDTVKCADASRMRFSQGPCTFSVGLVNQMNIKIQTSKLLPDIIFSHSTISTICPTVWLFSGYSSFLRQSKSCTSGWSESVNCLKVPPGDSQCVSESYVLWKARHMSRVTTGLGNDKKINGWMDGWLALAMWKTFGCNYIKSVL